MHSLTSLGTPTHNSTRLIERYIHSQRVAVVTEIPAVFVESYRGGWAIGGLYTHQVKVATCDGTSGSVLSERTLINSSGSEPEPTMKLAERIDFYVCLIFIMSAPGHRTAYMYRCMHTLIKQLFARLRMLQIDCKYVPPTRGYSGVCCVYTHTQTHT